MARSAKPTSATFNVSGASGAKSGLLADLENRIRSVRTAVRREIDLESKGGYELAKQKAEAEERSLARLSDEIAARPAATLADLALRARLAEHHVDRTGLFGEEGRAIRELIDAALLVCDLTPVAYDAADERLIRSTAELVHALGGRFNLARRCGVAPSVVVEWERKDEVPPSWHYRFSVWAQRAGYHLSDELFGPV